MAKTKRGGARPGPAQSQKPIIWEPTGPQELVLNSPVFEVLFEGTRGPGKGLPLDEPVYTPNGPRRIGDLRVGNWVSCPDGTKSMIIGVYPQGVRPTYQITFDDGARAVCDDQHLWPVHRQGNRTKRRAYTYRVITMEMVLRAYRAGHRLHVPTLTGLEMQDHHSLKDGIDPYILGLLLGDGSLTQNVRYCTADDSLAAAILGAGASEYKGRPGIREFGFRRKSAVAQTLKRLRLLGRNSHNKFVPKIYKNGSARVRLAVLQGLMDTDGTVDKKGYITFCSVSRELAADVQTLARSLGAKATLSAKKQAFEVYIQPAGKFMPFRLERKAGRVRGYQHSILWRRIVKIERLADQETVCIKIDHPLGLFVTRDFVVTHNSDCLLMDYLAEVGKGYGAAWRGIIFRCEGKDLEDLSAKCAKWIPRMFPNARRIGGTGRERWIFKDGEQLLLRIGKVEADYWAYHGHEYPYIGFDELTAWKTLEFYHMMKSCCRSSDPRVPRKFRAATNPYGPGHSAVKSYWIDPCPPGIIIYNDFGIGRVRIHGDLESNKHLTAADPEYMARLKSDPNPNRVKAWTTGDWNIVAGGFFADHWKRDRQVLPHFKPPDHWPRSLSLDWGYSKPSSLGKWAEVPHDLVLKTGNGRQVFMPAKSLVRYGEVYTVQREKNGAVLADQGLKLTNDELGALLYQATRDGEYKGNVADPSIFTADGQESIYNQLRKGALAAAKRNGDQRGGLPAFEPAYNDRNTGWSKMLAMLKESAKDRAEAPGLWVTEACANFIRTIPVLQADPKNLDDVDTDSEDHIGDETRYRVMRERRTIQFTKTRGG